MPPATVTTWPVTCPERVSDARTTTCAATSSGCATLRRRHRPGDGANLLGVDETSRHRRLRPAGCDGVHAPERGDPRDLVLQGEEQAARDRGLRGGVVGVARLAEDARRRADEDERAVPVRSRPRAGRRARRGTCRQVLPQRLVPALERQLPDRHVVARPDALNRDADVDRAERPARVARRGGRRRPRR